MVHQLATGIWSADRLPAETAIEIGCPGIARANPQPRPMAAGSADARQRLVVQPQPCPATAPWLAQIKEVKIAFLHAVRANQCRAQLKLTDDLLLMPEVIQASEFVQSGKPG